MEAVTTRCPVCLHTPHLWGCPRRAFGGPWFLVLAAIMLSGCTWTERDSWWSLAVLAAFVVGEVAGARGASVRWRRSLGLLWSSRDANRVTAEADGNMRRFWVVDEDAPPESRQFVAHMLTADAPMELAMQMDLTCGSCRHRWRARITQRTGYEGGIQCPACRELVMAVDRCERCGVSKDGAGV